METIEGQGAGAPTCQLDLAKGHGLRVDETGHSMCRRREFYSLVSRSFLLLRNGTHIRHFRWLFDALFRGGGCNVIQAWIGLIFILIHPVEAILGQAAFFTLIGKQASATLQWKKGMLKADQ